jgi:hypothetical protein
LKHVKFIRRAAGLLVSLLNSIPGTAGLLSAIPFEENTIAQNIKYHLRSFRTISKATILFIH